MFVYAFLSSSRVVECHSFFFVPERGYSDEEEEGEFSSVEEADDMTYGAPAPRRTHRQLTFNKADLSYTKVPLP